MRAGLLRRRLGAADTAAYPRLADALAPQRHWRFDEASGTTALDRIAGHSATLANGPTLGVDPLVRNAAGGKSIGLKGGPAPAHMTIADLVTSPAFTLDVALQVDRHPGAGNKYLIATTGGGSTPGEVSVEIEDDGAFGLWVRCWSVDDGGTPIIRRTNPRTVPIGGAFKLSYRRNGDGTQSVLIDGVAQALTIESGSDPGGWSAVPSTTWYIGVWPTLAAPFEGLIAELVAWQSAVADAALLSLARTRDVVWLGDFDAGSASQSTTKTIDTTPYVFPTTGLIAVKDTDGSLGTVASNGAAFDYLAGSTGGVDSFTAHVARAGFSSRIATITVTVATGQVKDGTPTDDAVPAGFANPVVDHAATGDAVADDTTELNAALGGSTNIWLAPGEDYLITGTVTSGDRDIIGHGARILYDRSPNDGPAIVIGEGQVEARKIEGLRIVNQNQSDWSNLANIGLDMVEVDDVWLASIFEVSGFTVGIRNRADTSKCAYKTLAGLGEVRNCRRGYFIEEVGSSNWSNSNAVLGGRFVVEAGVNEAIDRYGIISICTDIHVNHFNFIAPSFVIDAGTATARLAQWQGAQDAVMWFGNESETEDLVMDGGGTGLGGWMEWWGADTPGSIPPPVRINNPDPTQCYTIDLRRMTNGASANNIEDAGGVID